VVEALEIFLTSLAHNLIITGKEKGNLLKSRLFKNIFGKGNRVSYRLNNVKVVIPVGELVAQ